MSSQLLLLLKFSLLALLYLFLLRVVRAVWAELSPPAPSEAVPSMSAAAPGTADAPGRGRGVPRSAPPTGAVAGLGALATPSTPGVPADAPPSTTPPDATSHGQLVVTAPPTQAGRAVGVGPAGVLVGRGAGCDLVVDDSYVSQRHLRVTGDGPDHWWVQDLGSTNGTYVGGERVVAPRSVGRGEPISLGSIVVELR